MNTPPMQESSKTARTPLAKGNEALRQGNHAQAITYYAQVIFQQPGLAKSISVNLSMARQKYRANRQASAKPSVAVCGWELAHNAAGRAYTLATIYETFAQVEMIGSLFPSFGREIWEPIRDTAIAKHTFVVEDESKFIEQAIQLVAAHPYDIVHLSKPRAPNIFFGILYKLLWGAKVLMDIDDEELAFVGEETPISIDDYIKQHGKLPELKHLAGKDWTRLAVGLAKEFDGITVCNAALQQRYGGEIIRHARDETLFKPSPELKRKSREKYGIPQDAKVVLFFGTPREHKGLIETAQAIASLKRPDLIYCIVGSFSDESLKQRLLEVKGCNYKFLPNQPISKTPEILSIADCCVLLQNNNSTAAQFQTPAKLSDALGMGVPTICYESYGFKEIAEANLLLMTNEESIKSDLEKLLLEKSGVETFKNGIRSMFDEFFGIDKNALKLQVLTFDWKNLTINSAIEKKIFDGILHEFIFPISNEHLCAENKTPPNKIDVISPRAIRKEQLPSRPKSRRYARKMNPEKKNIKVFGNMLSNDVMRPVSEMNLPYFSVLVYAEQMGTQLRLTLEALAVATAGLNCSITVICDWNCGIRASNNFIEGFSVEVISGDEKKGFYATVSEFLGKSPVKNILIMRAGVVITRDGVCSLVKKVINDDVLDIAGVLTNNTPFINCQIKSGSNLLLANISARHIFGEGSYERLTMPSLDCFMLTRKALNLVPFPGWSLEQDSSAQSLIRWFQELSLRGGRSGIVLDCYAQVLSGRLVSDEELKKYLDPRSSQEFILRLNADQKLAEGINKLYDGTDAVIQPGGTICFILQSLKLGGGGLVIANLANHLILLGYDVRLYQKSHYEPAHKIGFNLLFEPRGYFELEHVLAETPVNTIYIATLWTTARDVEALRERKFGSRGLYYIQDYEPYFYEKDSKDEGQVNYRKGAEDSYTANLEWVYTSDWIKNELEANGHTSLLRATKINVGIDHSLFHPVLSIENNKGGAKKVVIGAMARPSTPRRGFDLLVRSLRIVKERFPDVEVIFFGEIDYEGHNIGLQIINKGIVEPQRLSELYKTFDIFVDTSDFQGFGLCALEAMSAGCSCVITNCGGVLEYAVDSENALIVPHDDAKVAEAITLLANNADLRRRLGSAGIATAKNFDIYQNAKAWSRLLNHQAKSVSANRNGCVVVVPVFNNINVVKRCLNSAFNSLRKKDILVIVDDASDRHTENELRDFASNHQSVILIRNDQNLGFVGSSNRGMSIARDLDKDIILLNSDTIVPGRWIERMEVAAYSQDTPAVVSPMATESSHLKLVINPGESFITADAWLHENIQAQYPEIITPEGWCFYVPRAVYQTIGFIDPAYGRGYCEESDLCMRTYAAGFELRCCDNLLVYHQGKVSFGDERSSLYEKNRKLFDRRWLNIYNRIYPRFIKKDPLALARHLYENSAAYSNTREPKQFNYLIDILDIPPIKKSIENIINYDYIGSLQEKNIGSVAFLLPEFLPYGGVLSVVSLVNELIANSFDAKIVVLKSEGYAGDNLKSLAQPIFVENLSDLNSQFPDVDLLVATGWITVYYAALVVAKKPWLRLAYYIQDFEPDFPDVKSNRNLYRAALETYRLGLPSFCKTKWIRDRVVQSGGADVKIVPPALDVDVFYRRDISNMDESCDILAMYRPDTQQRDPVTLLKVVKRIKELRPETKIWFFGETTQSQKLFDQGVINRACGVVKNDKLPTLYSQSKVFLETSLFHGFGRTIAEAMACGTACVITNSGGPSEFAKHNHNALVCEPKDVDSLVAHTLSILDDERLRIKISSNGRESQLRFNPSISAMAIARFLNLSTLLA